MCAEPSPDFASVLAAAVAANISIPQDVAATFSLSSNETGANIGIRTQSIQLLRDSAYRICEAYAAGAVNELDYATLLRRNQVFTTAVLAVEQLTGTSRSAPVLIGGTANVLAGEALVQAQALVEQQKVKLDQAKDAEKIEEQNFVKLKSDATKAAEVPAVERKLTEAKSARLDAEKNLASLEQARDAARQPSLQLSSMMELGRASDI